MCARNRARVEECIFGEGVATLLVSRGGMERGDNFSP